MIGWATCLSVCLSTSRQYSVSAFICFKGVTFMGGHGIFWVEFRFHFFSSYSKLYHWDLINQVGDLSITRNKLA